jgi:hypothetical protein
VFSADARAVVKAVRRAAIGQFRFRIPSDLSALDERLITFLATSQTNFITQEFRKRAVVLSSRARTIVAAGRLAGLRADAITRGCGSRASTRFVFDLFVLALLESCKGARFRVGMRLNDP